MPGAPIVVSMRSLTREAQVAAGAALVLAATAGLVIAAVRADGRLGARIAAIVFAAVLAAIGAFLVGGLVVLRRVSGVEIGPDGIRWDSTGNPWRLAWAELRRVSVRVGWAPDSGRRLLRRSRSWRVHLELVLLDPSYVARHPEMAHLQRPISGGGPDRFGVPLAQRRELVAPLDHALRTFGGDRYVGVIDDGRLTGPGYAPPE